MDIAECKIGTVGKVVHNHSQICMAVWGPVTFTSSNPLWSVLFQQIMKQMTGILFVTDVYWMKLSLSGYRPLTLITPTLRKSLNTMVGPTFNVNGDSMGRYGVYNMLPTCHVYINGLDCLTSWRTDLLKKLSFSNSYEMPTFYGNCKFVTALLVSILCQSHPFHVPPHPQFLNDSL